MSKNVKIISFFTAKCPNCGKGKVFKYGLYSYKFIEVNKTCECCAYKFEPEPGFYYGAMYFAYAINVGLILMTLLLFNMLYDPFPPLKYVITLSIIILFGFNLTGRLSRLLMLYLFGKPNKA